MAVLVNDTLYAVYLQDTNGNKRLVGGAMDLTEGAARARIAAILAQHTKPHKVEYFTISYPRGMRTKTFEQENIRY